LSYYLICLLYWFLVCLYHASHYISRILPTKPGGPGPMSTMASRWPILTRQRSRILQANGWTPRLMAYLPTLPARKPPEPVRVPDSGVGNYPINIFPLEKPKSLLVSFRVFPRYPRWYHAVHQRNKGIEITKHGTPNLGNWIRPVIPFEIAGTPISPRTFDKSRVGTRHYSSLPFKPWSSTHQPTSPGVSMFCMPDNQFLAHLLWCCKS